MNLKQVRGLTPRICLAAAVCLGLAGAANADNTLTEAGASVSNTFELSYSVSGTAQPVITNDTATVDPTAIVQGSPTIFTVDRKIDLTVTATNSVLSTPPGADATLTFTVLNEGNDNAAYSFSIEDLDTGGTTFDASSVVIRYLVDTNDDGVINDGSFTTIAETAIGAGAGPAVVTSDVPKGVLVFLQVQGTIDASIADDSTDDITLVAEVRDPTAYLNEASATPEAVTTASGGANTLTGAAQNVLADGTGVAGVFDGDADGRFAATGVIEVQSPDLSAQKTVLVIKEPDVSGPVTDCDTATAVADAKAVPGACVEYVIEVQNNGDTVSATNLVIDDVLPAEVTFVAASFTGFVDDAGIVGTGPILSAPSTPADSDCDGSTTCQIQLSDAQLDAGDTGQIVIRAEIK